MRPCKMNICIPFRIFVSLFAVQTGEYCFVVRIIQFIIIIIIIIMQLRFIFHSFVKICNHSGSKLHH